MGSDETEQSPTKDAGNAVKLTADFRKIFKSNFLELRGGFAGLDSRDFP